MTCKNCGMEQQEGVAFCTNCGAPTTTEVAAPQQTADPGKGLGTASLIVGIISIVLGNPVASVVGIILGSMGKKKSAAVGVKNGSANIGVILSIIGLVVGIIACIVGFFLGFFGGLMESGVYYY